MTEGDDDRSSGWEPLLQGEDADVVLGELEQIRRQLDSSEPQGLSLIFGETAHLLFRVFDALADSPTAAGSPRGSSSQVSFSQTAQRIGELIPEALGKNESNPEVLSLYYGPCGPGWLLSLLSGEESEHEDTLLGLDNVLLSALQSRSALEWDFIFGLSGTATYLGTRIRRSTSAQAALKHIVHRLSQRAEIASTGKAWRTQTDKHTRLTQDQAPEGFYDAGVAHGTPGALWALATAAAHGVGTDTTEGLISDGLRWMVSVAGRGEGASVFPDLVQPDDGESKRPCRLGWCYGDAGILAMMSALAERFPMPGGNEPVLSWARQAAVRSFEDSGVVDAGLCHGAAGLGHLFNRIYQWSGDELCYDAAIRWIMLAVVLRQEFPDSGGHSLLQAPTQGFLAGSSGVGLAFLAATSSVPPVWDALLCAHPSFDLPSSLLNLAL